MCNFKSGLIFKDRVVLAPIYNESHSSLLSSMNIEDSYLNAQKMFVRAELIPKNNDKLTNVSEWKFKVDQDTVPDWYEKDTERYEKDFCVEVDKWMKESFSIICGKLCVPMKKVDGCTYYMTVDKLFECRFGNDNNYTTSEVREKLNESNFAKQLKEEYGDKIVPVSIDLKSLDGFDDYGKVDGDILGLRNLDLHRECRKNIPNCDSWEWIATSNSTPSGYGSDDVRYVSSDGDVGYDWCDFVGAVRPFFILQS